jgi:hypothetical protein
MKFILTILALAARIVLAQDTTSTAAASTVTLSPTQQCLANCAPSDVTCKAICVGVPHPGATQENLLTTCVGNCDQGDGSAEASAAYASCRNACISSYIITSGTAAPSGDISTPVVAGATVTGGSTLTTGTANPSGCKFCVLRHVCDC